MSISWLSEGRYIFFESLRKDESPYPEIYQYASSKLNGVASRISPKTDTDIIGEEEQNFSTQIKAYLSMLESIYRSMISIEATFFKNALDTIDLTPFANIKNIINKMSLNNSRLTEDEYMTLIAFTNAIQNSGNDLNTIAKNINTAKNNISLLAKNFDNLNEEEKEKESNNYINNMGRYKKNLSRTLTKRIELDQNTILHYTRTDSSKIADRINSVLKSLSKLEDFQALVMELYQKNPELSTIEIAGGQLTNLIINLVTNEVINNSSKYYGARATTIAKEVVRQIREQDYDLNKFQLESSHVFSRRNSKASSQSQKSIEEIALFTDKNLADILESAANSQEILQKYEKFCNKNELSESWNNLQLLLKNKADPKKLRGAKTSFNNNLRHAVANSFFGKDVPIKSLKQLIKDNSNQLYNKITNLPEKDLSFAKTAIEAILPDFANGCKLTVTKSDISEILSTNIAKNLPSLIQGKIPGNQINMKDDVRFILDLGKTDIKHLVDNKMGSIIQPVQKKIEQEINNYIENTVGNFLEDYRQAGNGSTNVDIAEKTYIAELKQLVTQTQEYLNKIEADESQRKAAWDKINNTLVGAISVKDYLLYNNELGYHGGSLGSGGAPEGVINNIVRMYELGGITPEDKDNLMFAVLNCAPSAIGSGLKTSLEQYLLGGAALVMFDEGFSFGSQYIKDVQAELNNMNFSGPKTLTLYYLNQTYIPGSYILYNIYESLKEFYNILPAEKQKITTRNRVIITNNASPGDIIYGQTIQDSFTKTAAAVEKNIKIQFLFMAGMLDILTHLSDVFKIQ